MPRLTNNTREVVDFIIKGEPKNGVPPTDSIAPGETKDINALEDATYHGRLAAGMVTLADQRALETRAAGNRTQVQPAKE